MASFTSTLSRDETQQAIPRCGVGHQQMPLTFLREGETASVLKVRGTDEVHHHLENLGFVPGAQIKVVTEQSGNFIVQVKGSQVALDKSVASKIITC